jgi:hypothetical protein
MTIPPAIPPATPPRTLRKSRRFTVVRNSHPSSDFLPLILTVMDLPSLEGLSLSDADGEQRRMGDLWAEKQTIVVFLRHFG